MEALAKLRGKLDRADRLLLETLASRLAIVAEVARRKAEGLPFLRDHERESELLERVQGWARELDLDPYRVREIFREVIAMSLKIQEETLLRRELVERTAAAARVVTYQGVEGCYSHLAAMKFFAAREKEVQFAGFASFEAALAEVEEGRATAALLPIENTTAGSINQTYDLLQRTDLEITGEVLYPVQHCLLGIPGARRERLRRILSHPQALAQCSRFLASMDGVEIVAHEDTAAAARAVRDAGDPEQAAIASEDAARRYDLEVLARGIADQQENWTRFVIISAPSPPPDPRIPAKTSLVFITRHTQGALARCLDILAEQGLNLTKLESRPVPRRPWEYQFYVDFEGSLASEPAQMAVARLRRECPYLKVLGSYPARTTRAGAVDRIGD